MHDSCYPLERNQHRRFLLQRITAIIFLLLDVYVFQQMLGVHVRIVCSACVTMQLREQETCPIEYSKYTTRAIFSKIHAIAHSCTAQHAHTARTRTRTTRTHTRTRTRTRTTRTHARTHAHAHTARTHTHARACTVHTFKVFPELVHDRVRPRVFHKTTNWHRIFPFKHLQAVRNHHTSIGCFFSFSLCSWSHNTDHACSMRSTVHTGFHAME